MTKAEKIFCERMRPHFAAGLPFEDAARAVLADDARIMTAFCDQSHSYFVPGVTDRSCRTRKGAGDLIRQEITRRVYDALRAKAEG